MTELQDFFSKHISIIKNENKRCEECGSPLSGVHAEVAHILPKGKFKSIAMDDDNVIYLCGFNTTQNCHSKYDNLPNEKMRQMNIFDKVSGIFSKLEDKIEERIHWKDYDRWEK